MSSQIKGLSQFIADVRASSTQEAERARVQTELASLRKKFSSARGGKDLASKSKNGYEHRKVVSKLLYIYILGYDVDIGTDEIGALINMPKFAEKQVGYLALSLLLYARDDLQSQVERIVVEDLRSPKEVLTSLALNYVSTWDFSTQPVSDKLVDLVYQLMVSPTSSTAVVKKAALTFLNFYRQDPERFTTEPEWPERVERISAILAGPSLGVVTSVVSLLIEIAKTSPNSFDYQVYPMLARKLEEVFDGEGSEASDYRYYHIAAPWLVAKLCKLLCVLYSPEMPTPVVEPARKIVASVVSFCVDDFDDDPQTDAESPKVIVNERPGSQQHNNARILMFFESAKLGITLGLSDSDPNLATAVLFTLREHLKSKDVNSRYFALEALQTMAGALSSSIPQKEHIHQVTNAVLTLVKDRDISIRRQALDALFQLVDSSNVEKIAAELLDMLVGSDLQIRPQMVARLAVLIEQFATSHEWYFDTCITLLEIGGSYAGEEVWQRLAQVVVNNEALHEYAVKRIYETLNGSSPASSHATAANPVSRSDAIVKLGALILGEFSSVYKGDAMDLFVVLQDQVGSVSWQSEVILLNAYMKLAAKFPHMRPAVIEAISMYRESQNLESQQRANEYLPLLSPENAGLLSIFANPMPPFGEDTSKELFTQMTISAPPLKPTVTGRTRSTSTVPTTAALVPQQTASAMGNAGLASVSTGTSSIANGGGGAGGQQQVRQEVVANDTGSSLRRVHLSSNWEFGFKRMLTHSEAVLFQDALLQVGCRYDFREDKGKIVLYLKNISSFEMSALSVQVTNPMNENTLVLESHDSVTGETLRAGRSLEYVVNCEAKQPFALTPTCRVTYLAGTFCETVFKLPIILERFMSPSSISLEQFTQRWDHLGTALEFTKQFKNYSATKAAKAADDDHTMVQGMQYGLVHGAPANTVFGAGVIHTSAGGLFGSLIVVQADAAHDHYKVTVRTTQKKLAAVVLANNFAHAYQL